ncbi:efflux RND transporter periplasmic adaptor subunit [Maribellus luteus]|uniref:Efflux RND transporter periplasmic adaptor subunit n=1 Tax=Maribellus luteus TaxID=2305463 RepID=A0A399SZX4_9BACT|nr:efflux RND transporter periplasmic adaptor subunit [Maribellus luteus]RIJ47571.1 efflux RND transporter periplasmic adaptor subunit [Maribellus luteus]
MNKPNLTKSRLIVAFMIAFSLFGCRQTGVKQMPPVNVEVVNVKQQNIVEKVDFVGEVSGYQDISIRARVPGYLEGVHFKEGFPVKKGQLLYTVDKQVYEAEVAAKQSLLAEARSQFAKAKSDFDRYKPLAESNAVSMADLDAAKLQFDAATSMVEAAEANLEIAKINLSYTQIKSPIDGIIGKSQADVGELVGQYPIVVLNTVSKMDEIFVEFFLPENQYLRVIKMADNSKDIFDASRYLKEDMELVLADGSIHDYKGSVTFIDRGVNSNTGTILVQTHFKNPDRIVRPGQYAKVRIPIEHKNALLVPQKCIKELQGQYSVFVVNPENKVETRQITPGNKIGDLWLIKDGLLAGDRIISEGIQKVKNDMVVNPTVVEFNSQYHEQ